MKLNLFAVFALITSIQTNMLHAETRTFGVGLLPCAEGIDTFEERSGEDFDLVKTWIAGFFTGLAAAAPTRFNNQLKNTNPDGLFEAVINHCRLNSTLAIGDAAINLANNFE